MADKHAHAEHDVDSSVETVEKIKSFWSKNGKAVTYILGALLLLTGGFWAYKNFVQQPKEAESLDKSFKAEEYYKLDSFNLALNGDGVNPGFIKIADKYSGTQVGNLAKFYAGVCFVKTNQNQKAVDYLKDFSTDSKQVQQRAYKLLGDAYGDLGKGSDAVEYYKKAAKEFETDQAASAEALFSAAYCAQHLLNKPQEAIELYTQLKQKFPRTQQGFEADKYLAQLGKFNVN